MPKGAYNSKKKKKKKKKKNKKKKKRQWLHIVEQRINLKGNQVAKGSLIQNAKVLLKIFLKVRKSIIKLKQENIALKKRIAQLTYKNIYDLEGFQSNKKIYKNYLNRLN